MKYILYLLVFAVLATGLTSCESNSTSSNSTTKELEVTPSKTSVGVYETFSIKARMTNTPLSDVMLYIDFGDGVKKGHIMAGDVTYHKYGTIGTYTITVTAVDEYTQDTLATKSIQIIVSDAIPIVAFDRDLIDTTLLSRSDGSLGYITFSFTTNAPISKVRYQYGDGRIDSTTHDSPMSITYETPGTYKVIVDVYNDKGYYWASDTMTCIIRLPEVTLDMLRSSYNISVSLAVDSTSSFYESIRPFQNLSAGIGTTNDSISKISWNGNSFDAHYLFNTTTDRQFTGTISNDLKNIETMTVSIFDSLYAFEVSKCGYILSNLELCGMNNQTIIYRAMHRPLSTFVNNTYLQGEVASFLNKAGDISGMIWSIIIKDNRPLPYAYVVFTRK